MITFSDALSLIPEDEHYELEERAAIHEFDGKLSRTEAEQRAVLEYFTETTNTHNYENP